MRSVGIILKFTMYALATCQHARKDYKRLTAEECDKLKAVFAGDGRLSCWECKLNSNEYMVCLLIKIGLTPSDINVLTGLSSSNISNIRKRLLLKMAGRNGSPKDFDIYITGL